MPGATWWECFIVSWPIQGEKYCEHRVTKVGHPWSSCSRPAVPRNTKIRILPNHSPNSCSHAYRGSCLNDLLMDLTLGRRVPQFTHHDAWQCPIDSCSLFPWAQVYARRNNHRTNEQERLRNRGEHYCWYWLHVSRDCARGNYCFQSRARISEVWTAWCAAQAHSVQGSHGLENETQSRTTDCFIGLFSLVY